MALFDRMRRNRKEIPELEAPETVNPGMLQPMNEPVMPDPIDMIEQQGTEEGIAQKREADRMAAENAVAGGGFERIRREAEENPIMTRERLNEATKTLLRYKEGKASVNRRVIRSQEWWKLKNWEQTEMERGTRGAGKHKSNTGWLWNCIIGKHADAIDSYPEPIVLPRMEDDKAEANKLSKIVPVVMELNEFEQVYSDASWQKMREGTGVYGIFWDPQKLNGLGDIDISQENILNLYWEPGIKDIQDSRNLFYVNFEDKDILEQQYPQLEGKLAKTHIALDKYRTDDTVNLDNKAAVIDWYYHKYEGGRKILHYCKYVDETCLYSSEEEEAKQQQQAQEMQQQAMMGGMPAEQPKEFRGYYEHGLYPFVLDPLFPVEGSPAGYGYIDIAKDTQMDIDTLSQAMVKNMEAAATPRFFIRKDGSINEDEFADWSKPFIHSGGMLGQDAIRAVEVNQINTTALSMLQQKIDEIKFVTGNQDVNNGGVPSGVTAASAIAALKEDSGRSSKDSSKASYRSFAKIVNMVIELIRQFYDIPRQFRIIGQDGNEEFTSFDNSGIVPQVVPNGMGIEDGMRLPVFDIEVRAQRENAYTKMSQNELALQFYQLGILNPQNTDQALMLIDMMDFRGKDELRRKVEQNGTIQDTLMQVGQIAMALAEKYQPEVAMQLQQTLAGIMQDVGMSGGGPGGTGDAGQLAALGNGGDALAKANDPNESGIVRKARERAQNASRPD